MSTYSICQSCVYQTHPDMLTTYCIRAGRCDRCGRIGDLAMGVNPAALPIAGTADPEHEARLDAERVTLEFAQRSARRVDSGKQSIEDSPLFGGARQKDMFA